MLVVDNDTGAMTILPSHVVEPPRQSKRWQFDAFSLAYAQRDDHVVFFCGGRLLIFDVARGEKLVDVEAEGAPNEHYSAAFIVDDTLLAHTPKGIMRWTRDGKRLESLDTKWNIFDAHWAYCFDWDNGKGGSVPMHRLNLDTGVETIVTLVAPEGMDTQWTHNWAALEEAGVINIRDKSDHVFHYDFAKNEVGAPVTELAWRGAKRIGSDLIVKTNEGWARLDGTTYERKAHGEGVLSASICAYDSASRRVACIDRGSERLVVWEDDGRIVARLPLVLHPRACFSVGGEKLLTIEPTGMVRFWNL